MEYELLDTGIFKDDPVLRRVCRVCQGRSGRTILVRITGPNRGRTRRNCTSCRRSGPHDWAPWIARSAGRPETKPQADRGGGGHQRGRGNASGAGGVHLLVRRRCAAAFTDTKRTTSGLPGQQNESPYVKDGINDCVVQGNPGAVNPGSRAPRSRRTGRLKVDPASRGPCGCA